MSSKKNIFFFGFCAAVLLGTASARMRKEDKISNDYSIKSWHTAPDALEGDFYYIDNGKVVIYASLVECINADYRKKNIFNSDKGPDHPYAARFMQPRVRIPFDEDVNKDYIYCFASPVFEFWRELKYIKQLKSIEDLLSYNALRDCFLRDRASALQMLCKLKSDGLKILVVEGHRLLPYNINPEIYLKFTTIYRQVINDEIRRLGIPLIRVPEDLIDEHGFTKEQYRNTPGDNIHPNYEYNARMVQEILNFVDSDPDFNQSPPTSEAAPADLDPVAAKNNAPYAGLLKLLKLRDESHTRLLLRNQEMAEALKQLTFIRNIFLLPLKITVPIGLIYKKLHRRIGIMILGNESLYEKCRQNPYGYWANCPYRILRALRIFYRKKNED